MSSPRPEYRIGPNEADRRLDRLLRRLLPGASLGHLGKLLRQGRIRLDGRKAEAGTRPEEGQCLEFRMVPEHLAELGFGGEVRRERDRGLTALEIPIVLEEDGLLVLDKPSGLAVHAGSGHETRHLTGWVQDRHADRITPSFRPSPAHRLDRETSGLVAFGLDAPSLRALTEAFRDRRVTKIYRCLVAGLPDPEEARLEGRYSEQTARHRAQAKLVPDPEGLEVALRYRVLAEGREGRASLLEVELLTGRLHQIRAQLAEAGHPLIGDERYGGPAFPARLPSGWRPEAFLLHAARLLLRHPGTGEALSLESALPGSFGRLMPRLGIEDPRHPGAGP